MRNLTAISNVLQREGIEFRTLVPTKSGTWIYVVDLKRELRPKVVTAAKRLGANVSTQSGKAEFVGDDDQADEAKVVFDQEIQTYESKNPNLPPTCDVSHKKAQETQRRSK